MQTRLALPSAKMTRINQGHHHQSMQPGCDNYRDDQCRQDALQLVVPRQQACHLSVVTRFPESRGAERGCAWVVPWRFPELCLRNEPTQSPLFENSVNITDPTIVFGQCNSVSAGNQRLCNDSRNRFFT